MLAFMDPLVYDMGLHQRDVFLQSVDVDIFALHVGAPVEEAHRKRTFGDGSKGPLNSIQNSRHQVVAITPGHLDQVDIRPLFDLPDDTAPV